MTAVSDFLYTLIILPIESIIESAFYLIRIFFPGLGTVGATAGVSMAVNFLTLPIYNMADAQQLKEREIKKKLAYWSSRIRKTFKGDERFMMLSYYYKINRYHPAYAIRETASILVQVPFFIAAYHFLSTCADLEGARFGPIGNLATPDGLLHVGGMTLNLLPILMTVINLVSGVIYTRGAPLREKLQSPILALIFLFLLYGSPSGLVIYWTLNNLFSLAKNAVKAFCPKPWIVVEVAICAVCMMAVVYVYVFRRNTYASVKFIFSLCCVLLSMVLPLGRKIIARFLKLSFCDSNEQSFESIFIFSCLAMALILGMALPSSLIASSPAEFSFLGKTDSPFAYVGFTMLFASGLFILWPVSIYSMTGKGYRPLLSVTVFVCAICMLCNAWIFKSHYGDVSITGELDISRNLVLQTNTFLIVGPIIAGIFILLLALCLFSRHRGMVIRSFMSAVCLTLCLYSGVKIHSIHSVYSSYKQSRLMDSHSDNLEGPLEPIFHLSKSGKNIFVFFLDRSMGVFIPYIMRQFPNLLESYRGFTFYPNTVSFSTFTVEGAPGLYGGYEYTPQEINRRGDMSLNDKTNEAQLMLPVKLSGAGYSVTVTDSPNTDFVDSVNPDLFKERPNVREIFIEGKYSARYKKEMLPDDAEEVDELVTRGLVRFFILQCLYPALRPYYYIISRRDGFLDDFIKTYSTLFYLPELTIADADCDTYTMFYNMTPHNVMRLALPDYHPERQVQKTDDRGASHIDYPFLSGDGDRDSILAHYECNAAALIRIGKWLDSLRTMGVYDNTRIIIVGDHGRDILPYFSDDFSKNFDYSYYNTTLMIKDFRSNRDIVTDTSFMTNADTPYLVLKGLGLDMTNPFSGCEITDGAELKSKGINVFQCINKNPMYLAGDTQFPIDINRGYHVSDDIYKEYNWIPFAEWVKSHPEDMPEGVINGGAR